MKPRIIVAALALSATGLIGIATHEGYTERAVIPTQGDRPTIGFGSTVQADGSVVKLGQKTDPVNALKTVQAHLSGLERQMHACLTAPMTQAYYDALVSFAYNIGAANFCGSTLVKRVNAEDYTGACDQMLRWRYMGKFDCSTAGNKRCWGLWVRRQAEQRVCLAAIG